MLTKKIMAVLTVLMTAVYFVLIWVFLPESVVGPRSQHILFLMAKTVFLGATAAFATSLALIVILKKEFVMGQLYTLIRFRHLLFFLVKRDFIKRYRRSVLGVVWSMLKPLLTMLVMTMVFSFIFRSEIEFFPVYLFSGLIIFNFFNESTSSAMFSVIGAGPIIKKVYVPKYVFPVSHVISALVNLFFTFLAFMVVFIFTGAPFRWTMLFIPIPILYTFLFSLGIGMILSTTAVFFLDVTHMYGVITLLIMYLSALFYPVTILPEWVQQMLGVNPIYHYISYFRQLTLHGVVPGLWANTVCIGFAMAALCGGIYLTMSKQDKFILHL
jgi:ABC-type polysaccharide/polyol phosphate export permease